MDNTMSWIDGISILNFWATSAGFCVLISAILAAYVHLGGGRNSVKAVKTFYWSTILSVCAIVVTLSTYVAENLSTWAGWVLLALLITAFIGQGQEEAEAGNPEKEEPRYVFLMTMFSAATNVLKQTGLRFFPLKEIIFGFIKINVNIINLDFATDDRPDLPGITVKTEDDVETGVKASVGYKVMTPLEGKTYLNPDGELVIPARNFVDVGGHAGIKNLLQDRIITALVESVSGIKSWRELYNIGNGALVKLIKAIGGDDFMPKIPSSVPSDALEIYFGISKGALSSKDSEWLKSQYPDLDPKDAIAKLIEADEVSDEGEQAKGMIEEYKACGRDVPEYYEDFLKFLLRERRKKIKDINAGKVAIEIPAWGIIITQVMIGERTTDPDVIKAAEDKAVEREEALSEMIQAEARLEQATRITNTAREQGEDLPLERAIQMQQIEAGKVRVNVSRHEIHLSSSPEMANAMEKAGPAIATGLAAFLHKSGESKSSPTKKTGGSKK